MNMLSTIVPKSDQINADDLIAGPVTITITEVKFSGGTEQPVSMYFDGSDKAYRPCKSMCRVLVANWGPDAKAYVGRSLTLYRDPKVKWGGLDVGGIRISHMSHIDSAVTMALTTTRSNRAPFTVKPLVQQQRQPAGGDEAAQACLATLKNIARGGMTALEDGWKAITPEMRKILRAELPALKTIAEEAADDFAAPSSPHTGDTPADAGPTNTAGDAGAGLLDFAEGKDDTQRGDGDAEAEARQWISDYIGSVKNAPDDAGLQAAYADGDQGAARIRREFPDLYAEIDPYRPADAPERVAGGQG